MRFQQRYIVVVVVRVFVISGTIVVVTLPRKYTRISTQKNEKILCTIAVPMLIIEKDNKDTHLKNEIII